MLRPYWGWCAVCSLVGWFLLSLLGRADTAAAPSARLCAASRVALGKPAGLWVALRGLEMGTVPRPRRRPDWGEPSASSSPWQGSHPAGSCAALSRCPSHQVPALQFWAFPGRIPSSPCSLPPLLVPVSELPRHCLAPRVSAGALAPCTVCGRPLSPPFATSLMPSAPCSAPLPALHGHSPSVTRGSAQGPGDGPSPAPVPLSLPTARSKPAQRGAWLLWAMCCLLTPAVLSSV